MDQFGYTAGDQNLFIKIAAALLVKQRHRLCRLLRQAGAAMKTGKQPGPFHRLQIAANCDF